jgi:protein quaking
MLRFFSRYLAELLAERHKLGPFIPVIPHSVRLLNQEILRVSTLLENASLLNQSGLEHGSPLTTGGLYSNGAATDMNGWTSAFQSESSPAYSWLGGSQGSSSGLIVKKTMKVEIPVDKYPTYNFVGRILGPRGNSLKRVEANTDCRVLIRGRGSIKDPARVNIQISAS